MRTVIAWDIETCPYPVEGLSKSQRARYDKELQGQLRRVPEMGQEEASRLVRATHPHLGWICCISAIRGDLSGSQTNPPKSWSAASPEDESRLLERFWKDLEPFSANVWWATFNGKGFDVPFVSARTAHHHLRPSRKDLLNTYPYSHQPHADLMRLWATDYSFEDLCELLGVESPKDDFDGSRVHLAVEGGQLDTVVDYCERDARAVLDCLRAVPQFLH